MPRANAEIVRRIYEAWSDDEVPGPVDLLDPDIEYVNPAGAIEPGTRRGLTEFSRALQRTLEAWDYWRPDIEELREVGTQVVAVVAYRARGKGSGVEVAGRESALWTLREGKVVRYEWFHGPGDASTAASAS